MHNYNDCWDPFRRFPPNGIECMSFGPVTITSSSSGDMSGTNKPGYFCHDQAGDLPLILATDSSWRKCEPNRTGIGRVGSFRRIAIIKDSHLPLTPCIVDPAAASIILLTDTMCFA